MSIPTEIVFRPHHAELIFDEEAHLYRLKDGEILSSVTGILKAEGIQKYGPRDSAAEFAMQVGKWVHQAIEWYEKGTLDESSLSPGIALYLESYKKFRASTGFRPIVPLMETPLWLPSWRFSGTPDLPGTVADRFVIADLKTGGERVGDEIQIAAYSDLIAGSVVGFENIFPEGMIVYLQDDGSIAKITPLPVDEMFFNRQIFVSAMQVNRWKGSHSLENRKRIPA